MRIVSLFALLALVTTAAADTKKSNGKGHEPTAVVFVIDRSGSMQGPKMETAKDVVKAAIAQLSATDEAAVVVFDSEAQVVVTLASAAPNAKRDERISKIASGGGTNIAPALEDARDQLAASKAKRKHVVLISDGEAPTDQLPALMKQLRADKATLSAFGIAGADMALLGDLAKQGQGRVYQVDDLKKLNATMLKEIQLVLAP